MSCDEFETEEKKEEKKSNVVNVANSSMDLAHVQKRRACFSLEF